MKLRVTVLITGNWVTETTTNATATYTLQSSIPQTTQTPVTSDGDIDLTTMDPGNTYNSATDIEFTIDRRSTFTDAGGTPMNLSFTVDSNDPPPVVITGNNASGEFQLYETNNPNSVGFTDTDDLSSTYHYCLNINSQYQNDPRNFIFPLDPNIINRPNK